MGHRVNMISRLSGGSPGSGRAEEETNALLNPNGGRSPQAVLSGRPFPVRWQARLRGRRPAGLHLTVLCVTAPSRPGAREHAATRPLEGMGRRGATRYAG
jgi:hypothetical protein